MAPLTPYSQPRTPPQVLTSLRASAPQYKFIVDDEWKYAPDQTAMYDEAGNVNNVLEVQEYVPENLESLSSFDPPASPVSRQVSWSFPVSAAVSTSEHKQVAS